MIAQFFDRQDPGNLYNGAKLSDPDALRSTLESVRYRLPFFAELIGENGNSLLLGIGPKEGCVQFTVSGGAAPYFMAVSPGATEADGYEDFLIGDTATPVPKRYCMPYETLVEIAVAFLTSGERSASVSWEAI
jgi:hypothetical protein